MSLLPALTKLQKSNILGAQVAVLTSWQGGNMKTQVNNEVKVIKKPKASVISDGQIVIKVDNVVVGFSLKGKQRFVTPLKSGAFQFKIVNNPLNPSMKIYSLFELKPVIYVNQTVLQSHSAEVCEIKLNSSKDMSLAK